jgi:hypothetical protein
MTPGSGSLLPVTRDILDRRGSVCIQWQMEMEKAAKEALPDEDE